MCTIKGTDAIKECGVRAYIGFGALFGILSGAAIYTGVLYGWHATTISLVTAAGLSLACGIGSWSILGGRAQQLEEEERNRITQSKTAFLRNKAL